MLQSIVIKNFAIIDNININFSHGINIITGESGAGKSIIIKALNFISGARADKAIIKVGNNKAYISAKFNLTSKLRDFLQQLQLDDEDNCIIRRVINANGSSQIFINDNLVSLNTLSKLSIIIIDIIGQNNHQLLLQKNEHLKLLDNYANTAVLCKKVKSIVKEIKNIEENFDDNIAALDLLNFQLNELIEVNLDEDEILNIEKNYKVSTNLEQLLATISKVKEDIGLSNINNILIDNINILTEKVRIDDKLKIILEILSSAQINIKESLYEIENYLAINMEYEINNQLENRFNELAKIAFKHNVKISELLLVKEQIIAKIYKLNNSQQLINELKQQYYQLTTKLTKNRELCATKLTKKISLIMQELGMAGSQIQILFTKNNNINVYGAENIEFLVATNKGQEAKSLSKIASGGELSRIALAIAVVIVNHSAALTLVFDEVDVGISGEVATIVAKKLSSLAQKYQIICITHLAQVASIGTKHLLISKIQQKQNINVVIKDLSLTEKENEIARILAGDNFSVKSLAVAKEMVANAKL